MAPPSLPAGSRIHNARPATPRQFPFMAFIDGYRTCAGSLITRSAVLTSVWWCVHPGHTKKWTVRLGSLNRTGDDPNAWSVESVMVMRHPKYNSKNYDYNIAIIQLPMLAPVNEFIQPVYLPCSPDDSSYVGRQAIVAGTDYYGTLSWAEVLVFHNEYCKQTFSGTSKRYFTSAAVTDRQLCAGTNTSTVWDGDRGGPLVLYTRGRYIQIGIFSDFKDGSGYKPIPALYTRVTSFIDWIKMMTGSD